MAEVGPTPAAAADGKSRRVAHRYELFEEIAAGGMGVVYRALDHATGMECALKRVRAQAAGDTAQLITALEREYRSLARLAHPRIVRVYDYGVDDDGPYYTMELLVGEDLIKAAPMSWRLVCRCLRELATSLSLLHARRLVHRDIGPGNVHIDAEGHCKLLDFGALVSFGYADNIVGSPPVVAPESFHGAMLDHRTDLYALGALAYWCLTGGFAYPARRLADLPSLWNTPLLPPSSFAADIPPALDALVMSLLSLNPMARPSSAAEVIQRLTGVAELPPEDAAETRRLAQSYLLTPTFVGRDAELTICAGWVSKTQRGSGGALRIECPAGGGRSRMLAEVGLRAQCAGASVVRVDASAHSGQRAAERALALRIFEALPGAARDAGHRHRGALQALGPPLAARLAGTPSSVLGGAAGDNAPDESVEAWVCAVSHIKPLVIQIDNVERADSESLGFLATLAKNAAQHPLLLMFTDRTGGNDQHAPLGLQLLRGHCAHLALSNLSSEAMLELVGSLCGNAPNLGRFTDWVHHQTAGSPMHTLDTMRRLIALESVRYEAGMWVLPAARPDFQLPDELGVALTMRITGLSAEARALACSLALYRGEPNLEFCERLTTRLALHSPKAKKTEQILDELAQCDVLQCEWQHYHFSSEAIREALLLSMEDNTTAEHHRCLGDVLSASALVHQHIVRIEAGHHLIQGRDELRGAALIAGVVRDSMVLRKLFADLYRAGPAVEAALHVYKRYRRTPYERLPLLVALAQGGYYEDVSWGSKYGDEALDVLCDVTGITLVKRLHRLLGPYLSLVLGLLWAYCRFFFIPRRERSYSFHTLLLNLCGTVATLTGAASAQLDAVRAELVAQTLAPFSILPERLALAGAHQFCAALSQLGRDSHAESFRTIEILCARFDDPSYYRAMPAEARALCVAGCHFARGVFAVFRHDAKATLDSADRLDACGMRLYAMIASQLRFLYFANRGELDRAALHREQVELHAARAGSAWQVELWEPQSLFPLYQLLGDVVALNRLEKRMAELPAHITASRFYRACIKVAALHSRGEASPESISALQHEIARHEPRSLACWSAGIGTLASALNSAGKHSDAASLCDTAQRALSEDDHTYVVFHLSIILAWAAAKHAQGRPDLALTRLEWALDRLAASTHPLALGLLHEARARLLWEAREREEFDRSKAEMEKYFIPTDNPSLIAKVERLREQVACSEASEKGVVAKLLSHPSFTDSPSTETEYTEMPTQTARPLRKSVL